MRATERTTPIKIWRITHQGRLTPLSVSTVKRGEVGGGGSWRSVEGGERGERKRNELSKEGITFMSGESYSWCAIIWRCFDYMNDKQQYFAENKYYNCVLWNSHYRKGRRRRGYINYWERKDYGCVWCGECVHVGGRGSESYLLFTGTAPSHMTIYNIWLHSAIGAVYLFWL